MIKFTKMHGLGNDFVVINAIDQSIELSAEKIQAMANRRSGIGFDQLLLLQSPTNDAADFDYRIFNADGGEVEQCGNGARCMAKFIQCAGLMADRSQWVLSSLGGLLTVSLVENDLVAVNMGVPEFEPKNIPFVAQSRASTYQVDICHEKLDIGVVSMGNPHAVVQVPDLASAPVDYLGAELGKLAQFPQGVNVGFMQVNAPDQIALRVYERGVGETLACGSGACAAVVMGRFWGLLTESVVVALSMGDLLINWPGEGQSVEMIGPAEISFQGTWSLSE